MARQDFIEVLKMETVICDGGMGTQLLERGWDGKGCPEELNLRNKELITEIHKRYKGAGSQMLNTNTFGGSRIKLDNFNLGNKTHEINFQAAGLAREVAGDDTFVSGSIGPTGEFLQPYGTKTFDEVKDIFAEQAVALKEGGVDVILIETMTCINELKAAVEGAKQTGLPIIASMTFNLDKNGFRTVMGVGLKELFDLYEDDSITAIGANCVAGIELISDLLEELKKIGDCKTIAQANAGVPELKDGKTVYKETPEFWEEKANRLFEIGVNIIGGCCGTSSEFVEILSKIKENY